MGTTFRQLVPEFIDALNAEIKAARRQGGEHHRIHNGQYLGKGDSGYLYRFRLENECHVPDECGVEVRAGHQVVNGTVVSIEGFDVTLALDETLVRTRTAVLVIKLWYILERLANRLQTLAGVAHRGVGSLFDQSGPPQLSGDGRGQRPVRLALDWAELNPRQREAVMRVHQPGAHFLWGPPGTGKTTTVGVACVHAAADGRVLVVAYSNVALDTAMLAATRVAGPRLGRPGEIVRLGTPRLGEVQGHPYLTVLAALRHIKPDLVDTYEALRDEQLRLLRELGHYPERQVLEQEIADIKQEVANRSNKASIHRQLGSLEKRLRSVDRLDKVRNELRKVRDIIKGYEDMFAKQSRIVGCTLARLVTDDVFGREVKNNLLQFNTVILDEASMASIPFAAIAACHATMSVLYAGDFRQLPPIVASGDTIAKRYLGRDIFCHAGIPESIQDRKEDRRMVQLSRQYRMHPAIGDLVSRTFYMGKLEHDDIAREIGDNIASRSPFPGKPLRLIDVSPLRSLCMKEPDELRNSRFNLVTAIVTMLVALEACRSQNLSIAVISPFRAHARLLRQFTLDLDIKHVISSTVHRFQGGEADVVVLDLVAADGYDRLGPLLGGTVWDVSGRLINVAVSRARGKLIVVADYEHIRRLSSNLDAIRLVLDSIERISMSVDQFVHLIRNNDLLRDRILVLSGKLFEVVSEIPEVAKPHGELFVAMGYPPPVPDWVRRANLSEVHVVVRGKDLHVSWLSLQNCRYVAEYSRINAVLSDRKTIALEGIGNELVIVMKMKECSAFLGNMLQLVPRDEHVPSPEPHSSAMRERGPLGQTCSRCGGVLWLDAGRYGAILRCLQCGRVRSPDVAATALYLKVMKVVCKICGSLPEAVSGAGGVYVRCSRPACTWRVSLRNLVQ